MSADRRQPGAAALRTTAVAVACAGIYFVHLPVAYAIVIGDNRKTIPFVLALLVGMPPFMEWLRRKGRTRVRAILSASYYTVVAGYLAATLYVAGPMGPGAFVLFAAVALCFGVAIVGSRSPRWTPYAVLAFPVLHAGWLAPPLALAVAGLFALALAVRRSEDRAGIGALPLAVALFSTMVHAEAATFYRGVSLFDQLRRPDAAVVARVPEGAGPLRLLPKSAGDPRYLLSACRPGTYVAGYRGRDHALDLLADGQAEPVARGMAGAQAGDVAAVDCARDTVWAGDYGSAALLELRAADLSILRTIELPGARPTFVAQDDPAGEVFVGTDFHGIVYALDRATGRVARTLEVPGGIAHFAIDPRGRRVFAVSGGGHLHVFAAPDWQPWRGRKFPGALLFQVAYDPTLDRVYLSNFLTGMLYALDARTLHVAARRWMGSSVRFLCVLPGGELAAASYFAGRVTLLSGRDLAPLGSAYVGKRVRWMALDSSGRRLLTTSTYGPIAVSLDALRAKH